MSDSYKKSGSHDCPPPVDDPAPQPTPPGDGKDCEPIGETDPPVVPPLKPCEPDPCCKCPTPPGTDPNCIENLIAKQDADIAAADSATKYKTFLDQLLKDSRGATDKYTRSKYEELLQRWKEQDPQIAELIRKLRCIVKCWRCVIECFICPLLYQLRDAKKLLYDDDTLYTTASDLQDLRYWYQRYVEQKERELSRIQAVLDVWKAPADKIDDALKANQGLIGTIRDTMGADPGKAIYDLFLVLIPRHLAIAPPSDVYQTQIEKKYTIFCECDEGTSDDCCGPDTGDWSFRERLVGPQPYLIDPNDYLKLICCLIEKRYKPVSDIVSKANAKLAGIETRINNNKKLLDDAKKPDWPKTFEKAAKGALPSSIDCCKYEKHDDDDEDEDHTRRH